MNRKSIESLIRARVRNIGDFNNDHGLTKSSLPFFMVDPYPVWVEPDDLETAPREMWVALDTPGDYLVACDPLLNGWSLIEPWKGDRFVQVISGERLEGVLDGM